MPIHPSRVPFHDRNLWTYYALFFAGSLGLIYQALHINSLGDSVDLLCLLSFVGSFTIRRKAHIAENALLITAGYILPLLIRNTMKLSYSEAPSGIVFIELAFKSSLITLALSLLFSVLGYILRYVATTMTERQRLRTFVKSIEAKTAEETRRQSQASSPEVDPYEENPVL